MRRLRPDLDQAAGPEDMLIPTGPWPLKKVCKYSSLTELQIFGVCSMRFPKSLVVRTSSDRDPRAPILTGDFEGL